MCVFSWYSELEDLERSHAYLTDLVERMSIPVFGDINVALQCTKTVVQNVRSSHTIERHFWLIRTLNRCISQLLL